MSISDKYEFETMEYGVTGWDGILNTNFQKMEEHMNAIRVGTLGETVAAYKAVYLASTGKWMKAISTGIATSTPAMGITLNAGVLNDSVRIQRVGRLINTGWTWTPGRPVYLSESVAGDITQTAPAGAYVQVLGYAEETDRLFLEGNIQFNDVL
jgi:hypothetical protein